jgi:hypothetical protein
MRRKLRKVRRLLPLVFGLFLLGAGEGAFATTYVFTYGGTYHFATEEPTCAAVARAMIPWAGSVGGSGSSAPTYYFYNGACSGSAHAVGDTVAVGFEYCINGCDSHVAGTWTATLSSIREDDFLDDIQGIPVQRVLVLVGSALMAALGWVMASR